MGKDSSAEAVKKAFSVGKLISFDWRIGVAVKSSNAKNLNYPYVAVALKVADNDSNISSHTFEMSLAEFQEFAKNLHSISDLLESMS